ncbi:MAG: hypothetical protein WA906_12100, partial [Pacificimonas sp.]
MREMQRMSDERKMVTAIVDGERRTFHTLEEIDRAIAVHFAHIEKNKVADNLTLENEHLENWLDYLNEKLANLKNLEQAADELQTHEDAALKEELAQ